MNKIKTLTDNKILRVSLDESWGSNDFISLFDSLNFLYKILIELDALEEILEFFIQHAKDNNKELTTKDFLIDKNEFRLLKDIRIVEGEIYKKINYSSISNNSMLIGDKRQELTKVLLNDDRFDRAVLRVSKIKYASPGFADLVGLGKMVEEIFNLFKYYFPNKERKLQQSLLEQDIISRKIENLKSLGIKDKELRKLLDVRNNSILNIKNLRLSDKITKIEIREIE